MVTSSSSVVFNQSHSMASVGELQTRNPSEERGVRAPLQTTSAIQD